MSTATKDSASNKRRLRARTDLVADTGNGTLRIEREPRLASPSTELKAAFDRLHRLAQGDLETVVATRSLNAIAEFLEQADSRLLKEVATAPTDIDVLLKELSAPESVEVLRQHDPLANARLRGLVLKREMLEAEGGAMTTEEVAKLLRMTVQAVHKRRKARKLIAVSLGRRGYLFSQWQFEDKVHPVLDQVLATLDVSVSDWGLVSFFVNGNIYLDGVSPLEALRRGNLEGALRAARAYGTQGAP